MKYLIAILLSIALFSCNKVNKPPKPENLISKDKMVSILVDLTVFNSAKGTNKTILENNGITVQQYIYEKHKIDSIQFKESNDYYTYDLKMYTDIYDRVQDSLEVLKQVYIEERDSKKGERQKQRDSLKREQKHRMIPKKFNDSISSKQKKSEVLPEIF